MNKNLQKALNILGDTLWRINNVKDMESFLEDLLTPNELIEIAERVTIFKEIKNGKSQRKIAEELGISVTTVNRGSRVIKYGTGAAEKLI